MDNSGASGIETIEREVLMLLRRADFKKTLDGKKNSLYRSGYLILQALLLNNPMTVGELTDLFQLDMSTMSRQIKALESKGLVERKMGMRDARINHIFITGSGREAVITLRNKRINIYREILNDWSDEDIAVFGRLLTRLNRKIEQRRRLIDRMDD